MELRRRRRTHSGKKSTAQPAAFAALVVFLFLVYAIGASKAGTWLAENVAAPVFRWIAPIEEETSAETAQTTPEPSAEEQKTTRKISAPAYVCYALQMGAYENEDNAENQAESLREVGAAGYVLRDDEWYRVLAAGYATETDRDSVAENLSAQGVETRAYTISYSERALTVTATETETDAFASAVETASGLPGAVYDACIAFDREQESVEEGKTAVRSIRSDAERALASLGELQDDTDGEVAALTACFQDVLLLADDLLGADDSDKVAFSSAFKRFYLSTVGIYGGYLTKQ